MSTRRDDARIDGQPAMLEAVINAELSDWWRTPTAASCWVCGRQTRWMYLDLGHQHPGCDSFSTKDGDVVIIDDRRTRRSC